MKDKCNRDCRYYDDHLKHLGIWCKNTGLGILPSDLGKACPRHISKARELELKRVQAEKRGKRNVKK